MVVSYFSGRAGGDWMKFHFWSGYAILTLLLFRIAWGFVGSTTARFSDFVKGPVGGLPPSARPAARPAVPRDAGHNPLGGAMVVVLLFAVLAQVVAGLFSADTDIGTVTGPLSGLVADKWIERVTALPQLLGQRAADPGRPARAGGVVYLVWKRQNLIGAMFTATSRSTTSWHPASPRPRCTSPRAGWRSRC